MQEQIIDTLQNQGTKDLVQPTLNLEPTHEREENQTRMPHAILRHIGVVDPVCRTTEPKIPVLILIQNLFSAADSNQYTTMELPVIHILSINYHPAP